MSDIQEYKITINFETKNADKAKNDIDKVKKSTGDLKNASGGIEKIKSAFSGLGKVVKGFIAIKTFKKLGETMFTFANKTSDYIETVNLFRASMGSASDKAQEFIDKAENLLGLDPKQMMDSISSFYNLAQGIGIAEDRAYKMSQNLTQLTGDLSSFANISLETAQSKLMSGFSGQVKPLREYGIAIDQATLQELAYSLGLQQRVKDMTRAQKTELIYYQIMKSTQKIQGDLGRSLISPANSLRVLKTEFSKLGRAVGSIFIPIMMSIIPVVRAVTQVLTQAAQAIARFFGFEMSDFNADLSSVGNLLDGVSDGIGDVGDEAEGTAKKLNKMLMPFDELNNISFDTGSSGGATGGGAGGGSLGIDLPEYDMFASMSDSMDSTIASIQEGLSKLFEPIQKSWNTYGQGVIDSFMYSMRQGARLVTDIGNSFMQVWSNGTGETTLNIIFQLLSNIFEILGNIRRAFAIAWETDGMGTAIIQSLWNAFNDLLAIVNSVAESIRDFTESTDFQRFATAFTKFIKGISDTFNKLTSKLKEVWENNLKGTFEQIMSFCAKLFEVIEWLWEKLIKPEVDWTIKYVVPIFGWIAQGFGNMVQMLNGWIDIIAGIFSGDWNRVWEGAQEVFEGWKNNFVALWEGIKTFLAGIGEWIYEKYFKKVIDNFNESKEKFKEIWLKIMIGMENAKNWINEHIIQPVSRFFSGMWDGFKNGATKAWEGIKSVFSTVAGFFKEKFSTAWTAVKNVFSTGGKIFDGIKEGIVNAFKNIVNAIIRGINKVISVPFNAINRILDKLRDIEIAGFKPFNFVHTFNVPQIPQLAEGGLLNAGQLFIANEAGPELIGNIGNRTAVANQDQITTAIANATYNAISKALSENRSSEQPTIVQVNLGNEQLYKGYGKYKNEQANMLGINI